MNSPLRALAGPLLQRAVRAYIVGPDAEDALRTCAAIDDRGGRSTVCYWNPTDQDPRETTRRYVDAARAMAGSGFDTQLAVKAPALGYSASSLAEVIGEARSAGLDVHFDSLEVDTADRTFALVGDLARHHDGLGVTLPARWARSLDDAEMAVETGLHVRVVKGAWGDGAVPERDVGGAYLELIDRLAGRAARVLVATHDPGVAHAAIARLRAAGTPCELELLLGMPVAHVTRGVSVPIRVYVPYGHPLFLPYGVGVRSATREPRVFWWFAKDLALGARKHRNAVAELPDQSSTPAPVPHPA